MKTGSICNSPARSGTESHLYDALQMRLKEASVTAGLSATNITVVDRAQIPLTP